MEMQSEVTVHAVKESSGTFEGRDFSSTTFHCEVDLPDNTAGRSIGRVTRPFKINDAGEFEKWAHLGEALPIKAKAFFAMEAARGANGQESTKLVLTRIEPLVAGKTINTSSKPQ